MSINGRCYGGIVSELNILRPPVRQGHYCNGCKTSLRACVTITHSRFKKKFKLVRPSAFLLYTTTQRINRHGILCAAIPFTQPSASRKMSIAPGIPPHRKNLYLSFPMARPFLLHFALTRWTVTATGVIIPLILPLFFKANSVFCCSKGCKAGTLSQCSARYMAF